MYSEVLLFGSQLPRPTETVASGSRLGHQFVATAVASSWVGKGGGRRGCRPEAGRSRGMSGASLHLWTHRTLVAHLRPS